MSMLKTVRTGKIVRPQRGVIYGVESVGKTTLAAQAPSPIFLDIEGGSSHLDVPRLEIKSWSDMMTALEELAAGGHGYQTVVVDSADWAERLAIENLLAETKQPSIESFGYGKGWVQAAERFARFLGKLDNCVSAGMHVLVIGHAHIRRVEPPDQMAAYDRYEPKLGKQTSPLLKEWADELYFAQFKTKLIEADSGKMKARGGKERVIYTTHSAAYDAKTRAGLAEELPLDWASIASVFPDLGKASKPVAAKQEKPAKGKVEAPRKVSSLVLDALGDRLGNGAVETAMKIEDFLIAKGQIEAGQNWTDASPAFLERIIEHPDRFIAAVLGFNAHSQKEAA
jgi:hypothetical protein